MRISDWSSDVCSSDLLSAFAPRQERFDQLHRQREQDRGTLLPGDLGQRLQVAQLDRTRVAAEQLGRLHQLLGRLLLAFGMDHLGAAHALGLGLPGDGADHGLVEVDVLDLDRSEEHTSELQSLMRISYAVFCLKKKKKKQKKI